MGGDELLHAPFVEALAFEALGYTLYRVAGSLLLGSPGGVAEERQDLLLICGWLPKEPGRQESAAGNDQEEEDEEQEDAGRQEGQSHVDAEPIVEAPP